MAAVPLDIKYPVRTVSGLDVAKRPFLFSTPMASAHVLMRKTQYVDWVNSENVGHYTATSHQQKYL